MDVVSDIYPKALESGVSIAMFWDSSIDELIDIIDCYNRRKLNEQRERLAISEISNIQLGDIISAMFSKDAKIRTVQQLAPELFDGVIDETERQEREWRMHMQKMREFTTRHNQRRKEE